MAFLSVVEYVGLMSQGPGLGQVPIEPPVAKYQIVNTGASTQGPAINAKTKVVRLHADSICAVEIGANPTAVAAGATGSGRFAANQTEYRGIPAGSALIIAAVLST